MRIDSRQSEYSRMYDRIIESLKQTIRRAILNELGEYGTGEFKYFPKNKEDLQRILCEIFQAYSAVSSEYNQIDTSAVIKMDRLFCDCGCPELQENFNSPIDRWNTSNITDMSEMFSGCEEFNQNISDWDVHNVLDMYKMFADCYEFNCNLSKWISQIGPDTDTGAMVYGAN